MAKGYKGLNDIEVEESRSKHGTNSLQRIKTKGIFRRFFDNLSDPIIKILLFALVLEIAFTFGNCNYIEILGIVAAILLSTVVSTVFEYSGEKAFEKMQEQDKSIVSVYRNSSLTHVNSAEIVVGDIICLSQGDTVPADGTVIEGELSLDQSALNGENTEVIKNNSYDNSWELDSPCRVFKGSTVVSGSAVVRVGRVGEKTYYGMVAKDVQEQTRLSPLKHRLSHLAKQISTVGYIAAIFVGIAFLFNTIVIDNGFEMHRIMATIKNYKAILPLLIRAFTLMITVVVVAVPEGLPMMITVVLSANMRKMLADNIVVKKLVGIETAGSLNILFTDKTGTLTAGVLSVDRVITEDGVFASIRSLQNAGKIFESLALCAKYNTDIIQDKGNITGGNATDKALWNFFAQEKAEATVKERVPFTSEKKQSAVILSDGTVLYKGAPEVIINRCKTVMKPNGAQKVSKHENVMREYNIAISKGERVIAVAMSEEGGEELCLVALVVLKDKVRQGVKEAVSDVLRAKIQVVMLTGDNKDTAVNIAEECGFYRGTGTDIALTSSELNNLSDDQIKEMLPRIKVIARALPQDKTRLVRLSQEMGLVVGMTGDGVNDAPSLKLADVGFGMGSGTDIAKGAGDIVILDNSFTSISKTVLYGRTIFKSIRKFITFQLIMNLAACGITLIGQFLGFDNPITIIQMLWVNIIMDTLGGLAFAGEPPLKYYMYEEPKTRDESILSIEMCSHIILNGVFTLLLLLAFLVSPMIRGIFATSARHLSAFYALFIFCGLFNCLGARSERLWIFSNVGKNKLFLFIIGFISVIQILIVYYGGEVFRSAPLSAKELVMTLLLASCVLVFDFFRRLFVRLK